MPRPCPLWKKCFLFVTFLTLHVPQTPQTKNMMTKKEFQKMKKGSYLINTSRGSTVCLSDLVTALKEKHLKRSGY